MIVSAPRVRRLSLPLALTFLASLTSFTAPVRAQEPEVFVIGASEGYGISDCFTAGVACGRIVADSWCESHGRGAATAYGLASDITASVEKVRAEALEPGAVIITCGD